MRPKGFSLIELVIVLVLISLLTVLIIPRLTRTMSHMEVRSVAKKISAILRYSRSNAINKNKIYQVNFDAESNLVSVQSAAEGDDNLNLENSYPLPKEVRMENIEVGTTLLESPSPGFEFYPNGGANGGSAVVRGEGRAYAIQVDFLTGVVKVEEAKEK